MPLIDKVISLPVDAGLPISGFKVSLLYAIIAGFTVVEVEYPLESVALNTNDVVLTLVNVRWLLVLGATLLMSFEDMDALFFAVALIVATALDAYRINFEESPVRATVVAFVSTTVPDTVGPPVAVAVNVHVVAFPKTVVLVDEE